MTPSSVDSAVTDRVRGFMEAHWRDPGFTCPNDRTYPWLWLWDSCFHVLIWAALGDTPRALAELRAVFGRQHHNGFVPHISYYDGFRGHDDFWGTAGTSSITQPPIYGHTIARLVRAGVTVPEDIIAAARAGFAFLLHERRRTPGGLVQLVHPWESGCDHSPRWDLLFDPSGAAPTHELWFRRKGELVRDLILERGAAISSRSCTIGSVAFNALIAFGAAELASVTGDETLAAESGELAATLAARWDPERATWADEWPGSPGSGDVRTLEALLPLLVEERGDVRAAVVAQLTAPESFAGRFGLRQVHVTEATYDPRSYWRGPSWPQLDYLFAVALTRAGAVSEAAQVRRTSLAGALASDFSEYWSAEDGVGGGAVPQSWAGLVIVETT